MMSRVGMYVDCRCWYDANEQIFQKYITDDYIAHKGAKIFIKGAFLILQNIFIFKDQLIPKCLQISQKTNDFFKDFCPSL